MVDPLRLQRLLRRITDDVHVLHREASAEQSRREDAMWMPGVKYSFVTMIESCVDVAQHVCAASGWGPPADNGDAMRLLGVHGVLEVDLASSMRRAVGFRNVLVHEYVEVDDAIVVARLTDLEPIRQFVAQVADLLAAG
ncbi:DUF86 domain-containing protein [Ruania suaedae]|uniref:type VII toxin-antitoxin system HepT family RNase toxin n=1 Tax=Ruania suaedae TaxID=2897774 RepID=UPI001E34BD04|nr:DUF86 domain-containing protein [Ruania suaedae]UFU02938.1 DUF86 domain-containing protein [Ruania suaedae]